MVLNKADTIKDEALIKEAERFSAANNIAAKLWLYQLEKQNLISCFKKYFYLPTSRRAPVLRWGRTEWSAHQIFCWWTDPWKVFPVVPGRIAIPYSRTCTGVQRKTTLIKITADIIVQRETHKKGIILARRKKWSDNWEHWPGRTLKVSWAEKFSWTVSWKWGLKWRDTEIHLKRIRGY